MLVCFQNVTMYYLELAQKYKYIIKIIYKKIKTFPTDELFSISGLLKVTSVYAKSVLIYTKKNPGTLPTGSS